MSAEWLPELSDDDLGVLIEALEAWEAKDASAELFGDLVGSMIAGGDPRARAELDAQRQQDKLQRERTKAVRKERSVLLRAKLLTLRNRRRVEQTIETVDRTS